MSCRSVDPVGRCDGPAKGECSRTSWTAKKDTLMTTLIVNGTERRYDGDPDMPLLWYLRDELGLTGTKFGCGVAACGACTVHLDGTAVRACAVPIGSLQGRRVVTIEALGSAESPHPLQRAWIEHQVPQCGYCQSGIL